MGGGCWQYIVNGILLKENQWGTFTGAFILSYNCLISMGQYRSQPDKTKKS